MNNPFTQADLVRVVQKILMGVLGCSESELGADRALIDDLDIDSLDFVELRYNLEKQLGIVLPQKSVLEHLGEVMKGESDVLLGDKLTELAAFALQQSFFQYTTNQVKAGMSPYQVMNVATIANWAALCHGIFDYLPEQCPDCGHESAIVATVGKPCCASCGVLLKPMTGDAAMAAAMPAIVEAWQQQAVFV